MNDHATRIRSMSAKQRELLGLLLARHRARGGKRLVAYVVPAHGSTPLGTELVDFLRAQLPDYMVPSSWVMLDRLPLQPNGKVDRRALSRPDRPGSGAARVYVPPRNAVEEELTKMWAGLFATKRVGVYDDFFGDLGGHSLLATKLLSLVRDAFRVELPVRRLFESPTVSGLALAIREAKRQDEDSPVLAIPPLSREPHRVRLSSMPRPLGP